LVIVLAASSLALARDVPPAPMLDVRASGSGLDPSTAGLYRVNNKMTFLYLTESLPGTLAYAEWQWRSGFGAPSTWWMDASDSDLYFFSKRGWARNWHPDEPIGPYNNLGLVVSISRFQEWFWCGVPLYDQYHRFQGYGCHPEYGPLPQGEGRLTPWMVAQIEESRPHVWQVLGVMCVLKRSEHIEVQPACPDSDDDIRVRLSGQYGSSCPQVNYTLLAEGTNIEIGGTITSAGEICAAVITSWMVEAPVGVLPAGTYTVTVNITDPLGGYWGFQDTLTFDVAQAELP